MKSRIEEAIKAAREANEKLLGHLKEMIEEIDATKIIKELKWLPTRRGEYYTATNENDSWISIAKDKEECGISNFCSYASRLKYLHIGSAVPFKMQFRPATPSETALLDSKLAEHGKLFDKDRCKLVDINRDGVRCCANCGNNTDSCRDYRCIGLSRWIAKPKAPIVGEMAIFWDSRKNEAICAIFEDRTLGIYHSSMAKSHYNAILFESIEQYKAFLSQ